MSFTDTEIDVDGGPLRITITPYQSAYFAGEHFAVTITFTNTLSPSSVVPKSASSLSLHRSHKRGSHSVSSAPLARPPTSPGLQTLRQGQSAALKSEEKPSRKGLIGVGIGSAKDDRLEDLSDSKRRTAHGRSLSVHISPTDLERHLSQYSLSPATPSSGVSPGSNQSPANELRASRLSSPLARSPLVSPTSHIRRASLADDRPPPSSSSRSTSPNPTSNASSTYSLVLDSIAESETLYIPPTPALPSPLPGQVPTLDGTYAYAQSGHSAPSLLTRPSLRGLGYPSQTSLTTPTTPRTPSSPLFIPNPPRSASLPLQHTGSTLVLYSYAQLSGTLALTPPAGDTAHARALRERLLRGGSGMGGGSMDISAGLTSPGSSRKHGRSASFSSSLFSFSLLGPTPTGSPPSPAPAPLGHSRARHASAGGEIDAEDPLPVFEVPSAMLAVDMELGPGEERSYTYSVMLPTNLPPTYKGRGMKFGYELVVGTCRAGSVHHPQSSARYAKSQVTKGSVSRVMKVPIRVYNHVSVETGMVTYHLLSPVHRRLQMKGQGKDECVPTVTEESAGARSGKDLVLTSSTKQKGSFRELQAYARQLVGSLEQPVGLSNASVVLAKGVEGQWEAGGITGCREAVEIITRNPRKVSYDVNKDGIKVAVLTFPKSAYRLGETVLGVVELNGREGRAKVLQISATLETHEVIPTVLTPPTASGKRQMRRVHDAHYCSFLPPTLRTTFSLDIPPDASPAFRIGVGGVEEGVVGAQGGLEWKVRLCLLVAVAREGASVRGFRRDGDKGAWGTSWVAEEGMSPMEKPVGGSPVVKAVRDKGWAAYLAASILGPAEEEEEGGWSAVRVETVECEMPIRVWPGGTAFKAMEVVFDV